VLTAAFARLDEERVALAPDAADGWVRVLAIVESLLALAHREGAYLVANDYDTGNRSGQGPASNEAHPGDRASRSEGPLSNRLPKHVLDVLEQYVRERPVPGYEEECERYYRALRGQVR
jgi:hypothetical protein